MANVLSNSYGFWDADGLVWSSGKFGNTSNNYPDFFGHVTIERATTDATSATLKVWVWHTMNVSDMSGTGSVKVGDTPFNPDNIAAGNYSATISQEPTLLLQAPLTGLDPTRSFGFYVCIRYGGVIIGSGMYSCPLNGHTSTPPTLTQITKSETDTEWVFDITYTSGGGSGGTHILIVAESGNKSVELEDVVVAPVFHATIPKTQLKEVLKVSAGAFDNAHRALLVQEWERVVPPLFHVSNHYERSIGVGCYAAEQANTVKIADDMEVIGGGAYSTTPVRIGRYKDTAYSVYRVVVPIAGTSSGSASFAAPASAYIRRIVSIKGSGNNGTYWLPIPYAFTSLVNQATLRCEVSGSVCTVNLVTGSNQSFVNGTVEAVVEFVC